MRKSVHTGAYVVLREHLVAARQRAGLSQAKLAAKLGRPQSFIAKYESGERRVDLVEFLEIARVLGAEPQRIFRAVRNAL
jgi:transcriptional regulator with XRE-family HTH domain